MGILSDKLAGAMRKWTLSMAGEDLEARLDHARADNEFGVDPYGLSEDFAVPAIGPFIWLFKNYFRCEVHGIEKVPRGRVLLVSNHGGQLPFDGAMIGVALITQANPPRIIRSMVEKWVPSIPYVSTFFARVGQIAGTAENCRRLLEKDEAILVFPEGIKGISKLFHERYQLRPFGLGFMRLALQTNTPVVPIAVVGSEEQAPALFHLKPLAKLLGMPVFPVTPTVVPFPLPTKYRIYFGEPMTFTGRDDDDDEVLEKKVKVVSSTIDAMLQEGLAARKSVFW